MKFLISILFSILFSCSHYVLSQSPDISGTWTGTTTVPLGEDLLTEYVFIQKGLLLEGTVKLKTLKGKDSTKIKFSGSITAEGFVRLKGNAFEYKAFGACLSINELSYTRKSGQEFLVGKWKGEIGLATCPAYSSGKIDVAKVIGVSDAYAAGRSALQEVNSADGEGKALLQELSKRKYFALVIGIDDYSDEKIQDLDNPVADARELQKVLQSYYTFEEENVVFLANPSRAEIIESFDAMSEIITDRDNFLVFYAGHGIWDERINQGFWLPANATMNSKAQWISNSTIRDYISGIPAKHTLIITDACFSGSIFKERSVSFANSKAMLELYKLPSRKAMTSGALKTVPDKSVFITYLLKNLISNDQPLLSSEELFRTFKIAVINNSANGQVPQFGPIGQAGDEGGDFIFLRRM